MKTIRQILDSKGRDVWNVAPDETVFRAIEHMAEKGVGALLVVEDEQMVGIISERDYARKVILKGLSSKETAIGDVMTRDVITCTEAMTVQEAMSVMTERRIRHLPVVRGDEVVGIVSLGDLVKARLADQAFVIRQLESYIAG